MGERVIVDLIEVWRDKNILPQIISEVKRQNIAGWRPWEIILPPDLLYPMIEEVSDGMYQQWSPILLGTPVQVGNQNEIAIRFVLKNQKESPVMIKCMPYKPDKKDYIIPVEVNNGNKIRV